MRAPAVSWLPLALVIAAAGTLACSRSGSDAAGQREGKTLRVSMIPTTAADKMLRESAPLQAYLQQATGA